MVAKNFASAAQRIGKSDGWMPAVVIEVLESDPQAVLAQTARLPIESPSTGPFVRVQFKDKYWVDAKNQVLPESSLFQTFHVNDVVRDIPKIDLSVLVVRWGGQVPVDEQRFDFAVSDNLIQECMHAIHAKNNSGKSVEIFTAHVGSTDDLHRVNEFWASEAMSQGANKVGFYFLWGCNNDGKPGYVLSSALLGLMERMESVGIVTRYPNHSQLYKAITSKEYQASLCTNEALALPPTIAVPSSLWLSSPARTAQRTMESLAKICGKTVTEGVIKVGCEWMGDGVRSFSGSQELESRAVNMLNGTHGKPPTLLVQQRIKHVVCEPRVLVFNGQVKGIRYTWNEKHNAETGRIHALRTCPQSRAARERFDGDIHAQQFVEKKIRELVKAWNAWLIAAGGEVPVFVRVDFLVERVVEDGEDSDDSLEVETNNGTQEDDLIQGETQNGNSILPEGPFTPADENYAKKFKVWTCELGEIGSSMVGFREGRQMLFDAIAESCSPAPRRPSRPAPKLPSKP